MVMVDNHDALHNDILSEFKFNLDEIVKWINELNLKILAIQVPEGIKRQALNLITILETKCTIVPILIADPCFGACDLVVNKLTDLPIDGILHLGHSKIPNLNSNKNEIPIKFIELELKVENFDNSLSAKLIDQIKTKIAPGTEIGLVCSVQYLELMLNIKTLLEEYGFKPMLGLGGSRVTHPGQVLGCNFKSATSLQDNVSAFLFIGDGKFHPLGISLATNKPVYSFNPMDGSIEDMELVKEKILKQRGGAISKVKEFNKFGIIVSFKPGQNRFEMALQIREKLKRCRKNGIIICLDNISPERIDYLPVEAFVSTACPRLAIDDYISYKKPILTPIELEIVLGGRAWEDYEFDEIL